MAQGLTNLIFTESAWSLAEVKRAITLFRGMENSKATRMLGTVYEHSDKIVAKQCALLAKAFLEKPHRIVGPETILSAHRQYPRVLKKFCETQAADLHRAVVRVVATNGGPEANKLLKLALSDRAVVVRYAAAKALAEKPGYPAREQVRKLCTEEKGAYKEKFCLLQ